MFLYSRRLKRKIATTLFVTMVGLGLLQTSLAASTPTAKKILLEVDELTAMATSDTPLVMLGKEARTLIKKLALTNASSVSVQNCANSLMTNSRLVSSDDLQALVFDAKDLNKQDALEVMQLLARLEPHALQVGENTESVDLYVDAQAQGEQRAFKPYETVEAMLVPPHKHLLKGNLFITGQLCAKEITALGDATVCGTLFLNELALKDPGAFLVFPSICVEGDAKVTGTVITDRIEPLNNDATSFLSICVDNQQTLSVDFIAPKGLTNPVSVNGDLCVTGTIMIDKMAAKTPNGTVLFCDHIETAEDKDVIVNGRLIVPGELVVSETGDVMVPSGNCIYVDCIRPVDLNGTTTMENVAIVDGKELKTNKIISVLPGIDGTSNPSGTTTFCSSICMEAHTTLSANRIAAKSGDIVTLDDDVCVTQTLHVDAVSAKDNGVVTVNNSVVVLGDVDAVDVNASGDICADGSVLTDFIDSKTTGTVEFLSNVCIDAGMTLSVDTIASKLGDPLLVDNDLFVNGSIDATDACLTGTLQADALQSKDNGLVTIDDSLVVVGDVDAVDVNASGDVCADGSVLTDFIDSKTTGTVEFLSNVCIDAGMTLSVDTIASKSGDPLLVNNDLCVTQTIRTDAIDCKDNDTLDVLCTLSVTGDLCVDEDSDLQVFNIEPKIGVIVNIGSQSTSSKWLSVGKQATDGTQILEVGAGSSTDDSKIIRVGSNSTGSGQNLVAVGANSTTLVKNMVEVGKNSVSGGLVEVFIPGSSTKGVFVDGGQGVQVDADLTVSTNRIAATTGDVVTVDDDLCVTQTIYTDAIDCKDNDFIDVLCNINLAGGMTTDNMCINDTLTVDTIEAKTGDRLDIIEPSSANYSEVYIGDQTDAGIGVYIGNNQTSNSFVSFLSIGDGGGAGASSTLDVGVNSEGGSQVNLGGNSGASSLNNFYLGLNSDTTSKNLISVGSNSPGGARIAAYTPNSASKGIFIDGVEGVQVDADLTVSTNRIAATTGDLVTVDDDLCVTQTIFTDAIDCKDNDTLSLLCDVNFAEITADGMCINDTLSVDKIEVKTGTKLQVFPVNFSGQQELSVGEEIDGRLDVDFGLNTPGPADINFYIARNGGAGTAAVFGFGSGNQGSNSFSIGSGSSASSSNTFDVGFGSLSTNKTIARIGRSSTSGGVLTVYKPSNDTTGGIIIDGNEGICIDSALSLSVDRICAKTTNGTIEICDDVCIDTNQSLSVDKVHPKSGPTIDFCGNVNLTAGHQFTVNGGPIGGGMLSFAGFTADADLDMNSFDIDNAGDVCVTATVFTDYLDIKNFDLDPALSIFEGVSGTRRLHISRNSQSSTSIDIGFNSAGPSGIFLYPLGGTVDQIQLNSQGLIFGGTPGSFNIFTNGGDIFCAGGTAFCASDQRVKTSVSSVDVDDTLDKLLTASVKTFKYIEGVAGKTLAEQGTHWGFIGQELINHFPDFVSSDTTMTFDGVEYENLYQVMPFQFAPAAIAGIQGLDRRFSDATRTTTFDAAVRLENGLTIVGDTTLTGTLTITDGDIDVDGNILVQGGVVHTSDARVKKGISEVDGKASLDAICQLQPVTYKFSQEFTGVALDDQPTQLGFVAQDVQQVMPEVVFTAQGRSGDNVIEDFMGIDYSRIVTHVAGAAKQLKSEVDELTKKLQDEQASRLSFEAFITEQLQRLERSVNSLK